MAKVSLAKGVYAAALTPMYESQKGELGTWYAHLLWHYPTSNGTRLSIL